MRNVFRYSRPRNNLTVVDEYHYLLNGARVVYTLDIETMRQVMQKYKKTGSLHADLPSGVPGRREPCHVEIALEGGNIVSCSITTSRGPLLTGDRAYQELTRLGRLRWTFVPSGPAVTQPGPTTRASEKNI